MEQSSLKDGDIVEKWLFWHDNPDSEENDYLSCSSMKVYLAKFRVTVFNNDWPDLGWNQTIQYDILDSSLKHKVFFSDELFDSKQECIDSHWNECDTTIQYSKEKMEHLESFE